ncbi:MAG: rhomboid family intramembrane serine protease [Aestuariibacter sp.]|uniref:rhomboid family intramembrane serine protease n=1 Tax=Marisediminitalea sp. TaxID=2662268 RepID=UPI002EB4B50B|nr:rhomboid family intramembrane serine protease [Aestuariibacter sp.]MEC7471474.1 rhomboid family intramembrane serine protease [Pseudomonadota bacterium]MCP4233044.1 rhomboid family intramembrane serine protease [Aestuariibacter sp.]MCP4524905.1 rhomboid family intramembrane serine protease [Aestuariibacter sp.]MCP4949114.1 rhomboid family intramembrane serine protease [Aestuariibacter sp.]
MTPWTMTTQIRWLSAIALSLLGVEFLNLILANSLNQFGLRPRDISHLSGIVTAPWLHGSLTHFASNFLPLLLFAGLAMQWGRAVFIKSMLLIWLGAGLCVWVLGRNAMHIGASGIVYGLFGFLVVAGFYSKKLHLLLISLVIAFLYGGMIFGVLPTQRFVSFEYHFFGFVMGVLSARLWAKTG